ncbi:sigma-54-dependent transcriptional regulator [Salinimonas iocasae]|uniref:Sigma-54-dependent Fis family transcriptional regulator n=1 Tax=Salinimonas iocasae TaxID=2572577 RepID=A0A5B7YH82_9ALTE|nr:sigma-54 dependent transcriptional regulator [Salinimonas iocasae]QCZ94746.1 sigma-54-dependent Fis family transcriptional regulator [Salinimonas iocasae]
MTKIHLLLVDDEQAILNSLMRTLRNLPSVKVSTAGNGQEAIDKMEQEPVDIVITDLTMPVMNGHELCAQIANRFPDTIRIMLTAHADLDNVLEGINKGRVWSYLQKPWDNHALRILVEQAIQARELISERTLLRKTLARYERRRRKNLDGFIGDSIAMQMVYSIIERSAPSRASVFITGESGTGKEVAAQALHNLSQRKLDPFIALNCAAIPSELMESEIFGHVKGAFSGAVSNRDGAATLADGGTLFLDELGEMDMTLQAKILRFIQTGTFQKVGSGKTEKVDVRFVCATNREPLEAIREKKLREDLYYRLNVISIDLPPLRERDNDAVQIANQFLQQFAASEEKEFVGFSSDAEVFLSQYSWPGNVRQLQNLIHSCVIMNEGPLLTSKQLGEQLRLPSDQLNQLSVARRSSIATQPSTDSAQPEAVIPMPDTMDARLAGYDSDKVEPLAVTERKAIEHAIAFYGDNVVQAAGALGVSPSTLYRKIQSWQ